MNAGDVNNQFAECQKTENYNDRYKYHILIFKPTKLLKIMDGRRLMANACAPKTEKLINGRIRD